MGSAAWAVRRGWCAPQAGDLAVAIDLVVLEHCELHLLVLVLDLLWLGVGLLLALFTTSKEIWREVECRLVNNTIRIYAMVKPLRKALAVTEQKTISKLIID